MIIIRFLGRRVGRKEKRERIMKVVPRLLLLIYCIGKMTLMSGSTRILMDIDIGDTMLGWCVFRFVWKLSRTLIPKKSLVLRRYNPFLEY